jgi:transcription elongation factor Elf1
MGRRRKQTVRIVRRRLPELFLCPNCGKNMVKVNINRDRKQASVICSNCKLHNTFKTTPQTQDVDVYCLFIDEYYGGGSREEVSVE